MIYQNQKIVTLPEIETISRRLSEEGKIIVTTNGAFDILHVGHVMSLQRSRGLGDVLIVGVNSDESVRGYKSSLRPIVPEGERVQMLAALTCVDYVVIFNELDPRNFLEQVKPHIHTKGGDYDPENLPETEIVRRNGGRVMVTPLVSGASTTNIIQKILKVYGQPSQ